MTSTPFMQLYVADYLGDTQHLSCEQHGAYILLLMTMWRAGGSLPNDDTKLARIVRLSPSKWARIADDIKAFFDVSNNALTQKRLAEELEKAIKKSEKRSEAGSRGGTAKALKYNNQDVANAIPEPKHLLQIPDIIKEEKKETPIGVRRKSANGRLSYPPRFEEFWASYPTDRLMSKQEAGKAWGRLSEEDQAIVIESLPAFHAYCQADPTYRIVHACRYLTQRRFEGFAKGAAEDAKHTSVVPNSPQWLAWLQHKRQIGERTTFMESEAKAGRPYAVPSEWPPALLGPSQAA